MIGKHIKDLSENRYSHSEMNFYSSINKEAEQEENIYQKCPTGAIRVWFRVWFFLGFRGDSSFLIKFEGKVQRGVRASKCAKNKSHTHLCGFLKLLEQDLNLRPSD